MYTCVKPLGQLLHAHAWLVLNQQFSKFIFTGKGNSGKKKDLLLRSGLEPGSDALQTTAFATEPMGLWQLWTSNLALILLTVAVSVDYSGIASYHGHGCIRDIWRKPTDSGITRYAYFTLFS